MLVSQLLLKNKKGYFFLIDVFIALMIITIGLMVLISSYLAQSERSQTTFTSRSLTLFMSNMSMARYNSPYKFKTLMSYDLNGYSNHDFLKIYTNTLLEQVGEFYYRELDESKGGLPDGHPDKIPDSVGSLAGGLVESVAQNIVPAQFEVEISIRDPESSGVDSLTPIYIRNDFAIFTREESPLLIPSKAMVMGTFENSLTGSPIIWGPYIMEVHVWQ